MKVVLILFTILAVGFCDFKIAKIGDKNVELKLSDVDVIAIIKYAQEGKLSWDFDGPNKGYFVDSTGKKVDSSNYAVTKPATITIKNVRNEDAAFYTVVEFPSKFTPPPGVHVDPGHPVGVQFNVLP